MAEFEPVSIAVILEIIEDSMNADAGSISSHTILKDDDNWDSMAVLMLMAGLDEKLGLALTENEIESFETAQDILDVVGSRGLLIT